jgi:carbonic anhydrase
MRIIGCDRHAPKMLARHLGVGRSALEAMAITDAYEAVAMDVAASRPM